jgi:uncharacterized protein YraI
MKKILTAFAFFALSAGTAEAYPARIVQITQVYAGPDFGYPTLVDIGPGSTAEIYGCLNGYLWCDVGVGPYRGWVYGEALYGPRTSIVTYGPVVGIPVVGFNIGYWDNYYRTRPFYHDRGRWEHYRPRTVVVRDRVAERPVVVKRASPGQVRHWDNGPDRSRHHEGHH